MFPMKRASELKLNNKKRDIWDGPEQDDLTRHWRIP
jgi:hypothetical protein